MHLEDLTEIVQVMESSTALNSNGVGHDLASSKSPGLGRAVWTSQKLEGVQSAKKTTDLEFEAAGSAGAPTVFEVMSKCPDR